MTEITLFIALLILCSTGDESVVQTKYGPVQGVVKNIRSFLGVPFVAPPTGDLRLKYPEPPKPWGPSILPTTSFKPGCPQNCFLPPHTCPITQSEDCLYINIYTPREANLKEPVPVMVFLPGGHFEQGSAACLLYDGTTIVEKGNVVLVTVNYRLGFLGWLTTENLKGNFGFMDQVMALRWVKDNIANFGGDPNKVTLFGQSAGATSIRAHLISPESKGLFHRVIIQSDPFSLPMREASDATTFGNEFCKQIGCSDNITCLLSKSVEDILSAQIIVEKQINIGRPLEMFLPYTPTVDGTVIPYHIFDALQNGNFAKVPFIVGDLSQDALLFVYKAMNFSLDTVVYEAIIAFIFGTDVLSVTEEYPPSPIIGDKRPQLSVLGTDYIFTCSARYFDKLINKANLTLYLYQFDHVLPGDLWGPTYYGCVGKVCHGSELPYEFAPPALSPYINFTAQEQILSDSIIGYWTNFAYSGDPNVGPYSPSLIWPKWTPSSLLSIHLATPENNIQTGLKEEYCDFWDKIGYHHGW